VKAFGQEARESQRYRAEAQSGVRAAIKAVLAHGSFDVLVGLVVGLGGAAILYIGARHVLNGQMTVGQLLLVLAYLSQLFQPLREVGTRVASMQGSLASAERVFHVLDEDHGAPERPDAQSLERASGAFHFDNVTFGYDPEEPIIRDVDIMVPVGAKVGIAGKTGSGKSTLLSLLPRFYDPQQGAVKLDGVDLRDLKLVDLRRQYGIVLQEAVLFSTSIRENIAYGRPDATEAEIIQAAKDAAAHDFIAALPEGYDTNAGDRGMRLSGGERQRVSLARAFLRDAPVLILDEPTSALDTETEALVIKALERLMAGRTTFMIAHRLSTLAGCDIRLQVADGRVIQRTDEDLDKVEFA
jgi:ATP-binding cassette subfamily B protein